jgi:hypothetical protein
LSEGTIGILSDDLIRKSLICGENLLVLHGSAASSKPRQPVPHCVMHQKHYAIRPQLMHDVLSMRFNRLRTDPHLQGDVLVLSPPARCRSTSRSRTVSTEGLGNSATATPAFMVRAAGGWVADPA